MEHIIGKAFVENDVSPNKARKEALNNAKIEALKKAGIGESVKAQSLLFTSETNGDFKDFFSSSSQIEIKGAVKEYAITSERMYCKDSLLVIYEVILLFFQQAQQLNLLCHGLVKIMDFSLISYLRKYKNQKAMLITVSFTSI